MKLQNFFRLNVIVIGIAAALIFPRGVTAQEIENTQWNDGPNVAAFQQGTTTDTTNNPGSAAPQAMTMSPNASKAEPVVLDEAAVTPWAPVRPWMFASLFLCIAGVAIFALVVAKHSNHKLDARVGPASPRPILP